MRHARFAVLAALTACWVGPLCAGAEAADARALADEILSAAGVPGGLCVLAGAGDGELAAELAAGGRFLVHGLEPDAAKADAAVRHIRSRGIYGQAWVEHYADKRLPYAENLVNLLVVGDPARMNVPQSEIMRVLCPGGVACIRQAGLTGPGAAGGGWTRIQKPRPAEMDDWGHPRHGPDGNAVSRDSLVGPPRRIRWVAGPMHEVSNIVTAGGRFFYAGVIARDAYNGLRIWDRKLDPTPARLGYPAAAVAGSMLPVAVADRLYVVTDGRLQALDAATGKPVRAYADAGAPREVLCEGDILVASGAEGLKALSAESGKLLWSHDARQPVSVVAGDGAVYFLQGAGAATGGVPMAGAAAGPRAVVKLDLATGKTAWRRADYAWAAKAQRLSYNKGLLVCEVSTFTNDRPGNGIHVLDARDGRLMWERLYEPGHAHYQQGRAIRADSRFWILTQGAWEGLDPLTGSTRESYRAGSNHCFPPVATPRFLIGEEMNFTDMATGQVDANRITKAACGREAGVIPANGLIYAAPKHCSCFPMLKSYAALAPAKPQAGPAARTPQPADFTVERGPAYGQAAAAPPAAPARPAPAPAADWPCYRADAWRSASAGASVPADLEILWTADIGGWPAVAALADWKENPWSRGPLTPPVAADGLVVVAQPDGHRVVALDARTGQARWDFTANGRIDSAPTLVRGLCLFGTRSGYVYALRAADGRPAWRLRAAPEDERIIAFGQLESPWPAAGSVLVIGDTAYVAAGRHPLADGGVRVLALDPVTAAVKWVKTITSLPMKNFYGGAGLEFDCTDLLVAECRRPAGWGPQPAAQGGAAAQPARPPARPATLPPAAGPDCVTMSRWRVDLASGEVAVAWESGFAWCRTGGVGVMVPRGLWTYGQRMDYLASGPRPAEPDTVGAKPRPLAAFRDAAVFASGEDRRTLFRRDFSAADIAAFDDRWFNQRAVPKKDQPGDRNRPERLSRSAAWTAEVFPAAERGQGIGAVVLAGDTVFVAGVQGRLAAYAAADGKKLAERDLPAIVWDGIAAANACLYAATQEGKLVCLGRK